MFFAVLRLGNNCELSSEQTLIVLTYKRVAGAVIASANVSFYIFFALLKKRTDLLLQLRHDTTFVKTNCAKRRSTAKTKQKNRKKEMFFFFLLFA